MAEVPTINEPAYTPANCPIEIGQETKIEINKGKGGLAISIAGGSDTPIGHIIFHEIKTGGAISKDGRCWEGDQIVECNGEDMRTATHDKAMEVLRKLPEKFTMVILRKELRFEDLYDQFSVEVFKKSGKGMGASVVCRRGHEVGVQIADVVGGSASAGKLKKGDIILRVNGEDMQNITQLQAANRLKCMMGKMVMEIARPKPGSTASSRRSSNASLGSRRSSGASTGTAGSTG